MLIKDFKIFANSSKIMTCTLRCLKSDIDYLMYIFYIKVLEISEKNQVVTLH